MSETTRVVIPYESMDPLAIGATDDESKKHRDTLELDIPTANLLTVVEPDEPTPVDDPTEAARAALAEPTSGPTFAELLAGKQSVAVVIDNQFRPTPSSKLLPAVFDAIEAADVTDVRVCCANGKVFPMSESDTEQKVGPREPRPDGAERLVVLAERPAEPGCLHVRRRIVGRHAGLAPERGRERGAEDHDRSGAGEPLGRGRRRQADPPRGGLGRDGRVEPLRVRDVAADALRRVRRADALRHRRGRVDVRPRLHDERPARHARSRDRRRLRLASRGASRGDPPLQRDLRVRVASSPSTARRTSRSAASSRPPTTSSSTRAGAACRPTSSSRTAAR